MQGETTDVLVELPQLRPGSPPSELEVEGEGIEVRSSRLESTVGSETQWLVRLRADTDPGVVPLVLRAVYGDGRSVEVDERLTVAPAPEASGFPWAGVVGGALLAAGFALLSLHLVRRKA